jgi:hypothetical protein
VDFFIVVPAYLLLLLWTPAAERFFDIALRVFAADHEADAATRI